MSAGFEFPIHENVIARYIQPITAENFASLLFQKNKRKRFCDSQGGPIKRSNNNDKLYLNFKFKETIEPILFKIFGTTCFQNKFGDYAVCFDAAQEKELDEFVSEFKDLVFIKSLLPCMIALDMNFESNSQNYTEIGSHEHQAKEFNNEESIEFLVRRVIETTQSLPYYDEIDGIACVPPSTGKQTSLPQIIAQKCAQTLGVDDFSHQLKFTKKNRSLQNEAGEDKWGILGSSGLEIDGSKENFIGKNILLIDDLYQSGSTLHFTAMHLQEAGASTILGLALVKSRRDDDNRERDG